MTSSPTPIDNHGPNTLLRTLRILGEKAVTLDIAVAFVSESGVSKLLPVLHRVAARGRVRVLTGLYQGTTQPQALRLLLRAQKQSRGRVQARLSRQPQFHKKYYALSTTRKTFVIVGSSNLTREGLTSAGELDLLLELSVETAAAVTRDFEREWENQFSVSLTKPHIDKYAQRRAEPQITRISASSIREIVGGNDAAGNSRAAAKNAPRYWRDYIWGPLNQHTQSVLEEETDWDTRGWDVMSTGAGQYAIGDRVFVLDALDGYAYQAVIRDLTVTATQTPDGRHFVAYRRLPSGRKRRLVPTLWQQLEKIGVPIRAISRRQRRPLSERQWTSISSYLKRP